MSPALCLLCGREHAESHLLDSAEDARPNGRPLRVARIAQSSLGSGNSTIVTYVDGTGDEFTSVGGSQPRHTGTREQRRRRRAARLYGTQLRRDLGLDS